MKTTLQILAVMFVLSSCGALKTSDKGNIGLYDDVYATPDDDAAREAEKPDVVYTPAPKQKSVAPETTPEPDYRRYRENPEEQRDQPDEPGSGYSDQNYYYDDEEDFSYGRSFRRLRYGDGYRDGYNDAMFNAYSYSNDYYYYQFGDPFWGWNRPVRTRFWVGYNSWYGWNVNYNFGYPGWGWRTGFYPCYNNFYDPWFGYNTFSYGYYSNMYYGGFPYGYYNPYYTYGGWYNGWYGPSYYNAWRRPIVVYNNGGVGGQPDKTRMYGPRETIGSNTPTTGRKDQISPRSRGGLVQQTNDGAVNYDPTKDNRGGMISKPDRSRTGGNINESKTNASDGVPGNSTYGPANQGTKGRESNPNAGETNERKAGSYDPSFTPGNNTYEKKDPGNPGRNNDPQQNKYNPKDEPSNNSGRPGNNQERPNNPYTPGRSEEPSNNRQKSRGSDQPAYENPNPSKPPVYERREEPRKVEPRREEPRKVEPRREEPRREEYRRIEPRGDYSRPSGGNNTAPGGGNSGGSSPSPSNRGRGR